MEKSLHPENYSHYEILRHIAKALTSTHDLNEILNMIMDFIGKLYKPANWSLVMVDQEKGDLYFAIAVGKESEKIKDHRLKMGEGIIGWTVQHGECVVLTDPYADERFHTDIDTKTGFKTETILSIPLISKEKPLGAIELVNVETTYFEDHHIELLQSLADFAAIAIENSNFVARIQDMSIRDDCTNLYNARHMHDLIEAEISRAQRYNKPFSIVFFDLDHFKNVNDTYGHLVGSQLLKNVGDILRNRLRPLDWTVRYGGDEFVFILPGVGREDAMLLATRIHDVLNETIFFENEGYNIKITASFGVATFPDDAGTKEEILKMADKAMYHVKESGRNSVIHIGQIK